jgi:ATP-dependent helicase/DNAse subunit B
MTFDRFAGRVLEMSPAPIRPLSPGLKRRLLARIVENLRQTDQLEHFARVATTPGLIDVLSRFVSELKRQEIWPDDFDRAVGRRATAADRELGLVYRQYQDLLARYHLYDAEGRFWSARQQLREGQRRAIESTRLVVADGFTDFTWTQYEILELLAAHAAEVFISLPLESDHNRRKDLFSKVHSTLDELRRRHDSALIEKIDEATPKENPQAAPSPNKQHLIEHLFTNPRRPTPAVDTNTLQIIAAGQPVDEIEQVALRIKRLLLDGDPLTGAVVGPEDIVVVFRSLDDAAPRVREVFGEYGLPYALEAQPRLAEAPVLSALRAVLDLNLRDWPHRLLRAVVSNNFLRPPRCAGDIESAKAAADWLIGELQIPAGSRALMGRVRALAEANLADGTTPPTDEASAAQASAELQRAIARQRSKARRAAPVLTALEAALASLPRSATPVEWSDALEALATDLGMLQTSDDHVALHALRKALISHERLSAWLGEPPAAIPQDELLPIVDELLQAEPLPGPLDETGRVRVLAAPSVRTLDVPYLFVAGLSEQSFPARQSEDAVLNETQRRRLIGRGLARLVTRADHIRDEMLLFYEVVTRASRQLYLSYPAMNAKAEPLLPSPFIEEVARIFGGQSLSVPMPADLSPIPRGERVFCPRDNRVVAVHRALAGHGASPGALWRAPNQAKVAASITRACQALRDRQNRDRFGRYEGMLVTQAARDELNKRFGPDQIQSASRLEEYAACPFRFWLKSVLHIEPPSELALDEDARTRGQLLHGAMAGAHRRLNEQSRGPVAPCGELSPQFIAGFREELAALLDTIARDNPLDAALLRIDYDLLCVVVEKYVEQFDRYAGDEGKSLSPAHFEVAFGLPADGADATSAPGPLVLGEGADAVRLAGRIDRIDVGAADGRPVFGIVDYKTGSDHGYRAPKDGRINPTRMQLEIYAMAVERLLMTDAQPIGCGYWFVRSKGYKKWLDLSGQLHQASTQGTAWERRKEALTATILGLARGIRNGEFPMHNDDDQCTSRCEYHKICRVNHARSLEKIWQLDIRT